MTEMQLLQEQVHHEHFDYRTGSPHLKHWALFDRTVDLIRGEMDALSSAGMKPTLLDVGAGHGNYTEPALAYGFRVTATEMSRASLARMTERYRNNERFDSAFDEDGSLNVLGDRQFSLILFSSMLHHIPDYIDFITRCALPHLAPGGTMVSIQDPLWYPRRRSSDMALQRLGYYGWRLTQGEYGRGFKTRLRRLRGVWEDDSPSDMVEYHVARQGCDEELLRTALEPSFTAVKVHPYWSSQSSTFQRIGDRTGRLNTFAVSARGFSRTVE